MLGDQVLAYVEKIRALDDIEAVTDSLLEQVTPFGFDSFAYGDQGLRQGQTTTFFIDRWPQEFLPAYLEEGIAEADFLIPKARCSNHPFTWQDAYRSLTDGARARADWLLDAMKQWGWTDGVVVPLHQPNGHVGMVSLLADRLEISPREMTAIQIMGVMTYLKAQELTVKEKPSVRLTRRETEVMHWVVAGKTDFEIGEILRISQSTTHFHVENAKRKLDSTTRAQAAARAVHLGLVKP